MTLPAAPWIAHVAYFAWLLAGSGDFIAHRRTDLPHTSGVAESATHLVQLAVLGVAVGLVLGFEPGRGTASLLLMLVAVHAVVGYADTRIAFATGRIVSPIEQHLHSVLDMAPIVALGWWFASTWPAPSEGDWALHLRRSPLSSTAWCAVLVPALLLCVVPALLEFRAAWRVRGERTR